MLQAWVCTILIRNRLTVKKLTVIVSYVEKILFFPVELCMKNDSLQGILKRLNTDSIYWSTVFARFQQCLNYGPDKIT